MDVGALGCVLMDGYKLLQREKEIATTGQIQKKRFIYKCSMLYVGCREKTIRYYLPAFAIIGVVKQGV